jgi:hypothetical protein
VSLPEYCRECGVYLAGGFVERDDTDPALCGECGYELYDAEPRQTLCNGTCDSCDCDVWGLP